jgi:hypothetical protein
MMKNQLKQNKHPDWNKNEPIAESRVVKTRYEQSFNVVEFRVFKVSLDGQEALAFGGGAFEEQDLERVAAKLSELARDFALSEAETRGYMSAIEKREEGNE